MARLGLSIGPGGLGLDTVGMGSGSIGAGSPEDLTVAPVFQNDFKDGNITPEIGTAGTFSRASSEIHADSLTTLAAKTSGNPCVEAFPLNGAGTEGGLYIGGARRNVLLKSEAPGDALDWPLIGLPTVTNDVGTFLGIISFGTINPLLGAGEGITQTVATAVASTSWVFSVYMSVASGSTTVTLTVEGDSGGSPETTTKQVTLTTTPQRFFVGKAFSSGATGNIKVSLTVDADVTIRLGGMQLEQIDVASFSSNMLFPSAYIKTTTAAASTVKDRLFFTGAEISALGSSWTITHWINVPYVFTDLISGRNKLLWNENQNSVPFLGLYHHAAAAKLLFSISDGGLTNMIYNFPWSADTWMHIVVTANFGALQFKGYKNGVELTVNSDSSSGADQTTWSGLEIGGDPQVWGDSRTNLDGVISRLKIYNRVLTSTQILALYNTEKADYGL